MANSAKGSKENPYAMSECEQMLDNGTWPGGYVVDDDGEITYVMKSTIVHGYSGYGSGSGYGLGCDYGSYFDFSDGSYNWYDTDFGSNYDGNDSTNGDGYGGGTGTSSGGNYDGGTGTSSGGNYGGGTGTSSGGSGGTSGSNHSGSSSYNKSAAINYLVHHATETYNIKTNGNCALAVRMALEAGGLDTTGHPHDACGYDSFLPKLGFVQVEKNGYTPKAGDIIVLEAIKGHPHGHIAMYTGAQWVSDFKQKDMWGGSDFKNNAEYTLWRK